MPFGLRNVALCFAAYGVLLADAAPHGDDAFRAAPPMITAPPSVSKRQVDVSALDSAQSYLSSCVNHCTDVVQVGLVSARISINAADTFCNDYGDKPGNSRCFCGNYVQNDTAVGSSVSACAVSSCTNVLKDAQTFLEFPSGYMSTFLNGLSSVQCDQRMFPAIQYTGPVSAPTPTSSVSSRSSSALPSSTSSSSFSTSISSSTSSASTSSSAGSSSTSSSSFHSSASSAFSSSSTSATPTPSNAASPNTYPMDSFTSFLAMAFISVVSLASGVALL